LLPTWFSHFFMFKYTFMSFVSKSIARMLLNRSLN
jgi:hypothetical protein